MTIWIQVLLCHSVGILLVMRTDVKRFLLNDIIEVIECIDTTKFSPPVVGQAE